MDSFYTYHTHTYTCYNSHAHTQSFFFFRAFNSKFKSLCKASLSPVDWLFDFCLIGWLRSFRRLWLSLWDLLVKIQLFRFFRYIVRPRSLWEFDYVVSYAPFICTKKHQFDVSIFSSQIQNTNAHIQTQNSHKAKQH